MPATLKVDWELLKGLVLQGFTPAQAADKVGCSRDAVRQRARRNGWMDLRSKITGQMLPGNRANPQETVCIHAPGTISPINKQLAKASQQVREALAEELVSSTDTLNRTPRTKSLAAQAKRASVAQTLASTGKTVFSWEDSGSQPLVRINVLASARKAEPEKLFIDVQTGEGQGEGQGNG